MLTFVSTKPPETRRTSPRASHCPNQLAPPSVSWFVSSPRLTESGHVTETEKLHQKLQQARNQSAAANEHLDSCKIQNLQEQIQASERSSEDSTVIVALHQELHEVKCQSEATEKELNSCKELSQRLQEQIEEQEKMISMLKDQMHKVCDASVVQLMEELQHHRTALNKSGEEKHSRSHRNTGQDDGKIMSDRAARQQDSLSPSSSSPAAPSADRAQCISTMEVGTQVEGAELGAGLEEVIGEYTQRIGQIRELHAAEIMDMENRHITESESLKNENRRLEQECVTLREGIDQLHPLQEGMQVLSLSELSVYDESADHSSLLAQITHLQAQLTQLRQGTHTNQQLHTTPTGKLSTDSMLQSLQVQLEKKQTTLMELRAQAEEKMLQELEQKQQWQDERRHLQRQVDELQSLLEGEKERGKATERERMRLEGRVSQMMERSSTSGQVSMQDSEQKSYKSVSLDSTGTPVLNIAGVTCSRDTESVVAKLQKMSSKISRFAVEGADDESFSWLLKSIQEVISFLQKYSSVPPVGPEVKQKRISLLGNVSVEQCAESDKWVTQWGKGQGNDTVGDGQGNDTVGDGQGNDTWGDGQGNDTEGWGDDKGKDVGEGQGRDMWGEGQGRDMWSAAQLTGGVSSVLSERLLHQNAELTGFVSRLTEEKNEQRNQILRLEEELRRQRHLKAHNSLGFGSEVPGGVLEVQKELWMREKSKMEKSLLQAEAEISRLRADIRANVVRDLNTSDADNATLKRIYGKYLRSESFRKALIYQKKYLLLLLGGFQECEEATLSLIAGMASPHVHTHTTFLECISQRRRGYSRFRSAARACIALFRSHAPYCCQPIRTLYSALTQSANKAV
ncbi:A-kinase anchor protein 9 [Bagarius yarrelli]|uniref:A-kinase anchor protein 9 n=1 Tax=Bagarius yarrelli TaxID=175774 RepID=A0A556VCT6_BAGYA|nr:A-kinase anchor protein 9 [Bagarius yarrelli]